MSVSVRIALRLGEKLLHRLGALVIEHPAERRHELSALIRLALDW